MKVYIWLGVISDVFPLVPALFYYKRLDFVMRLVAAFLLVTALSDGSLSLLTILKVHNDMPIVHIYIMASLFLLAAIYYYALTNTAVKKAVFWLSCVALFIMLLNDLLIEHLLEYPSISNTILSVLAVIFALLYFYQLLNHWDFVRIEKLAFFWINISLLISYSIPMFLFMLYKYLSVDQMGKYYIINSGTNIITNVLFTIGLLCKPPKTAF